MVTRAVFNTWLASKLDPIALRKVVGEAGAPEWIMAEREVRGRNHELLGTERLVINEAVTWREHTPDPSGRRGAKEITPADDFSILGAPAAIEAYLRAKGWAAWLPVV